MDKIKILPSSVIRRIAAGETIDQPSSIAKELIENAIDEKSTKIIIEIYDGGQKSISISDNGLGMSRKDASLCLTRYATSKIRSYDDILTTKSIGFRGEALASISSISELTIITKQHNNLSGTKIESRGSKIKKIYEYDTTPGTMIIVKNIFFNTPVRKKNLRNNSTELSIISKIVNNMALANPEIKFKLIHNGKIFKTLLKVDNKISRIEDIFGEEITKNLLKIKKKDQGISIEGWISSPQISYSTPKEFRFFVNNRWIPKNETIKKILINIYQEKLKTQRYPFAILFIDLPPNHIDINLHPSKQKISFLKEKQIKNILYEAINNYIKDINILGYTSTKTSSTITTNNSLELLNTKKSNKKIKNKSANKNYNLLSKKVDILDFNSNLWDNNFFSNLVIIGQHHNSFIICESSDYLIVIDQHAAHERIVFENLKLNFYNKQIKVQNLLLPEKIKLNNLESKNIKKIIPYLEKYGLNIEYFKKNIFVIKSIPTAIDGKNISNFITKIIRKMDTDNIKNHITELIDEQLLSIACHNSIRSNCNLNNLEIKEILQKLDQCQNSCTCPHGRPIWTKISTSSLKKKLGR